MSDEVRLVAVSEHDLQQMGAFAEIIDWDAGITEEEMRPYRSLIRAEAESCRDLHPRNTAPAIRLNDKLRASFHSPEEDR